MSVVGHGLGIGNNYVGGYTAYGYGIKGLAPVVNVAISFNTNLDLDIVNTLTANRDITFNLDLLFSISKFLELNPNIEFNLQALVAIATGNIIDESIVFNTNLTDTASNILEVNKDILFNLQTDIATATQNNIFNPEVTFNTNLDVELIKQLITDTGISLDIELSQEEVGFVIQFILENLNVTVVPEELRFLKIFTDYREVVVSKVNRFYTVKFENRTVVIAPQEDDEQI